MINRNSISNTVIIGHRLSDALTNAIIIIIVSPSSTNTHTPTHCERTGQFIISRVSITVEQTAKSNWPACCIAAPNCAQIVFYRDNPTIPFPAASYPLAVNSATGLCCGANVATRTRYGSLILVPGFKPPLPWTDRFAWENRKCCRFFLCVFRFPLLGSRHGDMDVQL